MCLCGCVNEKEQSTRWTVLGRAEAEGLNNPDDLIEQVRWLP